MRRLGGWPEHIHVRIKLLIADFVWILWRTHIHSECAESHYFERPFKGFSGIRRQRHLFKLMTRKVINRDNLIFTAARWCWSSGSVHIWRCSDWLRSPKCTKVKWQRKQSRWERRGKQHSVGSPLLIAGAAAHFPAYCVLRELLCRCGVWKDILLYIVLLHVVSI